jgi:dipeptidyl aminopeptidase/acylaminoacyl peptidase
MAKPLRLIAAILFLIIFSAQASANLPSLIPREVLVSYPERSTPIVSPDGQRLAYLATNEGVMNIWVRTIGQQDDVKLTTEKSRSIEYFFWQPDSQHILYRQDKDGDENWHIYQVNVKNKETRDLTPTDGTQARVIAIDPNHPDVMLVGLNIRDKSFFDVYRINLKTYAMELDTQNPGNVVGWTADNNMQVRVAQVQLPDAATELRVRDTVSAPWRTLKKWTAAETFGGVVGFTPDNKGLWIISSLEANAARLVTIDLATGKLTALAEDKQYDVSGTLRHPETRSLQAVQFTRARSEWVALDKSLTADFNALRKVRDGDFNILNRDLKNRTWVVSYIVDDGPVYYYVYDQPTRKATLLFSDRPAMEKYKLAKMRPISFRARDGMTIHGYLSLPIGVEPKKLPTVLFVHGGPWLRDTWGFHLIAQWLANRGYAVLQINFRGSSGYGKNFRNAGDREWAGKMHDDLVDGKNWAVKMGYSNPQKIGIMGGSYGAYAALVALTFTPDEFACGIAASGPSNLVTLLKTIPPYWSKSEWYKRVGNPETDEEFLKSRSPLNKVDRITKPLLIIHGTNDPRVPLAESEQIVEMMRKASKPVEYLVYTNEGHGITQTPNVLHLFSIAEQFLARYLGGRVEPPGEIKGNTYVQR